MKGCACLFVVSLVNAAASATYNYKSLHSDGQLSELSTQIASPTCPNNHCIELDHNFNQRVDPWGSDVQAISSNSSPDDEAPHEIAQFLADFSENQTGLSKRRHHIDCRVTIPPSRRHTQTGENVFGKGKKAKLQNDEPVQEMLATFPGGNTGANLSKPSPSDPLLSSGGSFVSALTEKLTPFENHPDLLNLDANIGKFPSGILSAFKKRNQRISM
ncbi:hypothetical protein PCANC_05657 [Puccinia coronata f. sp. avenae]|uniref:Uncharacterized protein n=1 Tax=Puccinia coronata f. sp. avenae TaxID=200324 RepID=A0A2N5U9L0_9BASI|nr:hypothetical protein PCASD_15166 [Puccinia coronata f. sp. avenae]PLW38909.1 hypothetical protein PCANC_15919 [Puccinia coronata f. sp. avenae]PLW54814.1 hypothetical protein PCANC_05657 [Puccinia coronata f. sp. avenae]